MSRQIRLRRQGRPILQRLHPGRCRSDFQAPDLVEADPTSLLDLGIRGSAAPGQIRYDGRLVQQPHEAGGEPG